MSCTAFSRTRTLIIGVIALATIAMCGLQATSVASAATSSGGAGCTLYKGHDVPDGASPVNRRAGANAVGIAMTRSFDIPGSEVSQSVPPPAWQPAHASAEELRYYGIPPRPTTPAELATWSQTWVDRFSQLLPADICVSNGAIRYASSASKYWSGVIANTNTNYTGAYGTFVEPSTSNPCPAGKAVYSSWVGVGGHPGLNLLQNGVTVGDPDAPAAAGPDAAFWEALNSAKKNPPAYIVAYNGGFIRPGDSVAIYTSYNLSTKKVHFNWQNLTSGKGVGVDMSSWGGYPASGYYDGRSAEMINEQPYGTYARNFGNVNWRSANVAQANGAPSAVGSKPHVTEYQAPLGVKTIGLNPDNLTSSTSFTNHWFRCA